MRYAITGNGLEETKSATLEKGKMYWMGASDSPSLILVTDIQPKRVYYIKTYNAEWDESPTVRFEQDWVMQDLVARAESTMTKKAREAKEYYKGRTNPFDVMCLNAHLSRSEYVGGKDYEFEQRRICNCCGSEMNPESDTCDSCDVSNDYRENKDASSLIK